MNRCGQVGPRVGKRRFAAPRVLVLVAMALLLLAGFPSPALAAIIAPYDSTGLVWGDTVADTTVLFNNGDVYGVSNGPTVPTTFTTLSTYTIKSISTYHFNGGAGAVPGTIGLRNDVTGAVVGTWTAAGLYYNYYWYVRPDITIGPGTYTVIDSDSATWAYTSYSLGMGFTRILVDAHAVPADTTPPAITVPGPITAEATSSGGAPVTYSASATDLVDGSLPVTCLPASGSAFPLGTSTVSCSASDVAGNTGYASFNVTVQDTTPPAVTVPGPITAEATGSDGAPVTYSASATDLVDGSLPVTCVPASGSTFPLGTTTVNCSAGDVAGNTASASFNVTVQDTTPPVGCPSLKALRDRVVAYRASGDIKNDGVMKSLLAKLDAAQSSLDRGNASAFQGLLNAFINEVSAKSGKGIGKLPAAESLIADALAILQGCRS